MVNWKIFSVKKMMQLSNNMVGWSPVKLYTKPKMR